MIIEAWVVNAFSSHKFAGNPAAVCVLNSFLSDTLMQSIAAQNNVSETAFVVPKGGNKYKIRWFSPSEEVSLCGHATLASAYVVFNYLENSTKSLVFESKNDQLVANRMDPFIELDFPAMKLEPLLLIPEDIRSSIQDNIKEVFASKDYLVVLNTESDVQNMSVIQSHLEKLDRRGVIFTAPGTKTDFVSRVFHPKLGIGEDPVCGSAHCQLVPYWSDKLGKKKLTATQLSKRRGDLICTINGNRVKMMGECTVYLEGKIFV